MRVRNRISLLAVFALLLSLFSPVSPAANAVTTITQTVTVTKANGAAYSGVLLAAVSYDQSLGRAVLSTPVTTNSSGVASVTTTVDPNLITYGIAIQPASGDLTHAPTYLAGPDGGFTQSGSHSVQLEAANVKLSILQPDGTAAPALTGVMSSNPTTPFYYLVRTGAFGAKFAGEVGQINSSQLWPAPGSLPYFAKSFSATYDNAGQPTLYSDAEAQSVLQPDGSGVYTLRFDTPPIRGALKTATGEAFTVPSGQVFGVTFSTRYSSGDRNEFTGRVSADGTIVGNFSLTESSTITVTITSRGTTPNLSFEGLTFYSNSSGQLSLSAQGPFVDPVAFTFEVRMPTASANFASQLYASDGTTVAPGSVNIFLRGENGRNVGDVYGSSGRGLFLLADGSYDLHFNEWVDPYPSGQYRIEVVSGVARLFDLAGTEVFAVSGVFPLAPLPPNLTIYAKTPQGEPLLSGSVEFLSRETGDGSGLGFDNGVLTNLVADGVYDVVLRPGTADYASAVFTMTVTAGLPSFVDADGNAIPANQDGSFDLKVLEPNLKFNVIDPRDSSLIDNAYLSYFIPGTNNNFGGSGAAGGKWAGKLAVGTYTFTLSPNRSGLSNSRFQVVIAADGVSVYDPQGTQILPNPNGSFDIEAPVPNVVLNVLDPRTSTPVLDGWVGCYLLNSNTNNDCSGSLESGVWGGFVADGEYSLQVQAYGEGFTQTQLSLSMTGGVATLKTAKGQTITPNGDGSYDVFASIGNITGQVVDSAGSPLELGRKGKWLNVQLQMYNSNTNSWNYLKSSRVGTSGRFYFSATDIGKYRVRIEPYGLANAALTFSEPFEITEANQADFAHDFNTIRLTEPNLKFKVTAANSTTPLTWAWINIESQSGQFSDGVSTGQTGTGYYAFSTVGTYKIMVQPNGGDSATQGTRKYYTATVTADANGSLQVSIEGLTPDAEGIFTLPLGVPSLTGTVKDPSGANVIPYSQVVAFDLDSNQDLWQYSVGTNQNGQWAMSLPAGTYKLRAMAPYSGSSYADGAYSGIVVVDAQGAVTVPEGQTANDFTVLLANPTWAGVVQDPDGNPIPYSGICFNPGFGFIGTCKSTDANGHFAFSKPEGFTGFDEGSSIWFNDSSGQWPTINLRGRDALTTAFGSYTDGDVYTNIVLNVPRPNFKGILREPSGSVSKFSWIEVINDSTGEWVGGTSTSSAGLFNLRLEEPSSGSTVFRVTVYPNGSGNSKLVRKAYEVTITANGEVTAVTKSDQQAVNTESIAGVDGYFGLSLGNPSVSGSVYLPDGATTVPWSQILPYSSSVPWGLWDQSSNSDATGAFSLGLSDGSYQLEAQVPWNLVGYARSAKCDVTISGAAVTTPASDCVNSDGSVSLKLRDANLRFKLVNAGEGLPFAGVSLWIGNYNIWTSAAQDGSVSIFIDSAEVERLNAGYAPGDQLQVGIYVSPPWGNSDVVNWWCMSGDAKPICSQLSSFVFGTDYAPSTINLGDVQAQTPNTKLRITYPNGSAVEAGAWASLTTISLACAGCRNWVGGSNSDASGDVAFNVDTSDSSLRYVVEVQAPWNRTLDYAPKVYDNGGVGYTYEELVAQTGFALGVPNLTLTVLQANGTSPAKWSGVSINRLVQDENLNWFEQGLSGYGTNQLGKVSVLLPANSRFKLYLFPGPGSVGTMTTCILATDAQGTVVADEVTSNSCLAAGASLGNGLVTLTLNAGNVQGYVRDSYGNAVSGAIVYATATDANSNVVEVKVTTDTNGKYGLQLEQGLEWSLKVFYVNVPGATTQLEQMLIPISLTPQGDQPINQDFELAVKP